jgi:hypothetical protein
VNISATQVEAYRQANEQTLKKEAGIKSDNAEPQKTERADKVIIPGRKDVGDLSLKLEKSTSLINQILSSEEKELLVKYFSRFGDEVQNSQIYSTDARTKVAPQIGMRVDIKV